jgi:hypothetical protein
MQRDLETSKPKSRWMALRTALAALNPSEMRRALAEADIRIYLMATEAAEREQPAQH